MARIAGVDLPRQKRVEVALTYIYGIGDARSQRILEKAGLERHVRVKDLSEEEVSRIARIIDGEGGVEGDLRKDIAMNVKRLMEIGSYRGLRHRRNLPVRGQRTHTNARTRKGPRRSLVRLTPLAASFRSAPVEKLPPAPWMTATKQFLSSSISSMMSCNAVAMALLQQFLTSGRFRVTTATSSRGLVIVTNSVPAASVSAMSSPWSCDYLTESS